ncbi:MAG: hypothetical protein L0Y44_00325 [Phycisphaerales bacterium]|nr:hypothetical protein [Phycisphaerales bacterium]MCI0629082.1 hypothetical protein [Phycisphaerales bacterium]MCI0675620.1 hypothetical protein [Phycisphaerales bacterium]
MWRRILLIAGFLAAGLVMNVAVSWVCAYWSKPGGTFDPLLLAKLRREFFARDTPQQQHFVDMVSSPRGAQFMMIEITSPSVARDAINGPYPMIALVRSGWPCMTLEGRLDFDASRAPTPAPARSSWAIVTTKTPITVYRMTMPVMLPFRPLWLGFAMNTLFYSACFAGMVGAWVGLRRAVRFMRSRCVGCGYPIGVSPVCTECGRKLRRSRPKPV